MSVPLWVAELSDAFWAAVGQSEPFPRDLRPSIARALPVAVILLPRLRLGGVRAWLQRNGIRCLCAEDDRSLRACLVAYAGQGLIFLDGADASDERRFSLAHELAHFLRDYWHPRDLARTRLGPQVSEVLDGLRPPTPEERLSAVLARVPLGFHVHLMQRDAGGRFATHAIAVAETDADRLAYELLAPATCVLAGASTDAEGMNRAELTRTLQTVYGLPAIQAHAYAALLRPESRRDPFLRQLS
jgi:hypothetical protein